MGLNMIKRKRNKYKTSKEDKIFVKWMNGDLKGDILSEEEAKEFIKSLGESKSNE